MVGRVTAPKNTKNPAEPEPRQIGTGTYLGLRNNNDLCGIGSETKVNKTLF